MDFLTLVGYLVAALAIAVGLYLMLRKRVDKDSQADQDDAEDLENIEFFDDDTGRIPVIPRHAREQLGAEVLSGSTDTANNESIINSQSQHETDHGTDDKNHHNDNDLLEQASHIKPASAREKFDDEADFDNTLQSQSQMRDQAEHAINDHALNRHELNNTEPNELLMQQGSHLVDSSRPDQEPAEDMFDQALAQLEAATAPENNLEKHTSNDLEKHNNNDDDQSNTLRESEAVEVINTDKQTANVEDWEGESALLDAHIEDQERRDDESALAQAEHIVALYVMPAASHTLSGERTIELLRQFGLRYGEMSLFHRFMEADGTGPLMFSVLRYTSEGPSGFDLETLPNEQVEGLAFFLALPSNHAAAGYDTMVSISTLLSREIKGRVCDEYMNDLSPQLREHYRHFVLEYRTPH